MLGGDTVRIAAALSPFFPAEVRYDDRTRAGVIAVLDLLKGVR